jgi:signal transduction histidine kinase
MSALTRSLSTRMVVVFGGLLAGVGAFMIAFFPRSMAEQAERSTAERAVSIVQVMSTAIAPSIEFEDADHATDILAWLQTAADARFAVVLRADGREFAWWNGDRMPANHPPWPRQQHIEFRKDMLIASVPIKGVGGGTGSLHVGFSLEPLAHAREKLTRTITLVALLVVMAGLIATLIAAALIVRPIRKITATAQQIARGDLPPELPTLPGHDEIAQMADALRGMLERVHERGQHELLRASRHAGMAEVATGVLHNVGNVLNSVNVTVELLRERLKTAVPIDRIEQLRDVITAMDARTIDASRLAQLAQFVSLLSEAFVRERELWFGEFDALRGHVDHIKRVVAMQNRYARQGGVAEMMPLGALVGEALEIACPASRRAQLSISVDVPDTIVHIDRHRVLQVLVNLVANARDAVAGTDGAKQITIRGRVEDERLTLSVTDTGMGFSPETGARMFSAGFTTKLHGHGYGLHSSALTIRQLGGELTAASDGVGAGATFTLSLPLRPEGGAS